MLKYFSIVQALSRSALATPNEAVTHQIRRLKESLENEFGGFKDPKKLINIVHPSKKVAFF